MLSRHPGRATQGRGNDAGVSGRCPRAVDMDDVRPQLPKGSDKGWDRQHAAGPARCVDLSDFDPGRARFRDNTGDAGAGMDDEHRTPDAAIKTRQEGQGDPLRAPARRRVRVVDDGPLTVLGRQRFPCR